MDTTLPIRTAPTNLPTSSKTHLELLGNLQSHHSDLLFQLASSLHDAAGIIKYRAETINSEAFKTRRELYEANANESRIENYDKWLHNNKQAQIDETDQILIPKLEARINNETKDSASDMKDYKTLIDLITSMIHKDPTQNQPPTTTNNVRLGGPKKTVYEQIWDHHNKTNKTPIEAIYELAAEKLFKWEVQKLENDRANIHDCEVEADRIREDRLRLIGADLRRFDYEFAGDGDGDNYEYEGDDGDVAMTIEEAVEGDGDVYYHYNDYEDEDDQELQQQEEEEGYFDEEDESTLVNDQGLEEMRITGSG